MSLSMLPYGYIAGKQPLITGAALEALRRDPRLAISEDHVVCLVCGAVLRHLTNTHVVQHAMTSADYKQSFGYNGRRSLMPMRCAACTPTTPFTGAWLR
jgi:hypothetical protein